jgi:hypothetical protein
MTRRRTVKTHFVPKIIFKTTFAGVVPLCVAATACGGKVKGGLSVAAMAFGDGGDTLNSGGAADAGFDGVAATGFVAAMAFGDGGDGVANVACIGFNGEPFCGIGLTVTSAGFGDGGLIGSVGATAFGDSGLSGLSVGNMAFGDGGNGVVSVACIGFGGEPCGAPDAAGEGHAVPTVAAIGFAVRSKG